MKLTPLRFLGLVLGLWIGGRIVALLPDVPGRTAPVAAVAAPAAIRVAGPSSAPIVAPLAHYRGRRTRPPLPRTESPIETVHLAASAEAADSIIAPPKRPAAFHSPAALPAIRPARPRLSGDAYLFLRHGEGAGLAPGAQLGGSQVFARLAYAVAPEQGLAATARLSGPLRVKGAEAAFGLRWTPVRALGLYAERRVALDGGGRNAWSIFAAGGVGEVKAGPLRLDGYAQAGLVGTGRRDAFVDGAMRVSLPVGRARIGAGIWGAAQPGAARLDIGPQATLHLGDHVTATLDGRIRIAGNARPGTGLALTIATGF